MLSLSGLPLCPFSLSHIYIDMFALCLSLLGLGPIPSLVSKARFTQIWNTSSNQHQISVAVTKSYLRKRQNKINTTASPLIGCYWDYNATVASESLLHGSLSVIIVSCNNCFFILANWHKWCTHGCTDNHHWIIHLCLCLDLTELIHSWAVCQRHYGGLFS